MGSWMDKLKGRVKEATGAATGNRRMQAEGKADTLKGNVKGNLEDAKRTIKDMNKPDRRRRS